MKEKTHGFSVKMAVDRVLKGIIWILDNLIVFLVIIVAIIFVLGVVSGLS